MTDLVNKLHKVQRICDTIIGMLRQLELKLTLISPTSGGRSVGRYTRSSLADSSHGV
jgi:hypothetical protein